MMKKLVIIGVAILLILTLSACGKNKEMNSNMNDMHHSSSGEVPAGLKDAENPTFKVGSQAIIKSDHMKGMDGAKATIAGAYDSALLVSAESR